MRFRYLAAAFLAVMLAAVLWAKPGYVAFDLPMKPHTTGYFWWESQRSELAYADSKGVLYVHRRVGTAYPKTQGWNTADDIFAHFDQHFLKQGWTLASPDNHDPASPEVRLVGRDGRRFYWKTGDESTASVVVWPVGGSVDGFHVVLTTINPSFLRRLERALD